MAADPSNLQYDPGQSKFFAAVPAGTGAAGTPGVQAADTAGTVIASPVVSVPYGSSQVPANMPRVPVTTGDTAGMSDDAPVPPSGDPMTGLSLAQVSQTGAGLGSANQNPHPNSPNAGR